jgi:hypothetical protein
MGMSATGTLAFAVVMALPLAAQNRPNYLDVTTVTVKPGKRGDFDAAVRRGADANRRHKGDNWIAFETVYGEPSIAIATPRASLADVERAFGSFERAMKEAFGAGLAREYEQFGSAIESMRSEIRVRRWDLSRNAPAEPEGLDRMIGEARWMRTTAVEVHRAKLLDFEKFVAEILDETHGRNPALRTLTTQSLVGSDGGIHFYFTNVQRSLEELDASPSLRRTLGEETFRRFVKMDGEMVVRARTTIARVMPELSNPPESVVNVSREFWTPKPPAGRRTAAARPQ